MSKTVTLKVSNCSSTVSIFKSSDTYQKQGVSVRFYTVPDDFDIKEPSNIKCLEDMYKNCLGSTDSPKVVVEYHKHLKKVW